MAAAALDTAADCGSNNLPQGHVKATIQKFEQIKEQITRKWLAQKKSNSPVQELEPVCRNVRQTASRLFQGAEILRRSAEFSSAVTDGERQHVPSV
eukprot:scaffold654131_cov53-Prasinocladus_malaysianus.AAC.1